ncbi:MAG: hypothetical protein UX65_C0004G0033 [Parcubacteria group bacterium GW2011_GWB1_46_8]|nr:MAG: hypothetical protein UX14_C0002G0002 [Parcubacteria group bacterium GW2011_GWF1_45_5]KKU46387.1 MAG: hypothetical protein UX65_C0004G0033 [Parcubacteria group bacterium GW2011_GWB1_46_8]KKU47948.1 MAG: hypothetical protein UX66_C0002G0007 [Parcubacteria group bacterium GW2011_GWF2_46_8]
MESTSRLSIQTKELLEHIQKLNEQKQERQSDIDLISVSNLTSGIEFVYEKIRNALDYHEEHLWLKNAILRILKRRLDEILAKQSVGRGLVEELIRGRYLENNHWEESKTQQIDDILEKYRRVLEILETQTALPEKTTSRLEQWFLGIAAVELENSFQKNHYDRLYIDYFWSSIKERLIVDPELASPEFDQQLYLSVFRNFLQADVQLESFELFRLQYPQWFTDSTAIEHSLANNIESIKLSFDHALRFPLRKKLDSIMKRRGLLISLLRDIIEEQNGQTAATLENPELLEGKLKEFYDKRYLAGRAKLQTAAIRAIIFLVLTKMALLFVTEIPYQRIHEGQLNIPVLLLNTLIPPFLLIGFSSMIRMPGEEQNFVKVVSDFVKIIKEPDPNGALESVKAPRKRSVPVEISLGMLYGLNFGFTGWLFLNIFRTFSYNVVDGFVFVFFLSLVSFFAFRLRKTANEITAVEQKENLFMTVVEIILLPTVELGRFLSQGLSALNLTAFIFDFLIETPIKSLTSILEEWFGFVREQKQKL